jgi:hypothetical protein
MKRFRIGAGALLALVFIASVTFTVKSVLAQERPVVRTVKGHISPLMAKLTMPDGKTQTVMVVASGTPVFNEWHSH